MAVTMTVVVIRTKELVLREGNIRQNRGKIRCLVISATDCLFHSFDCTWPPGHPYREKKTSDRIQERSD